MALERHDPVSPFAELCNCKTLDPMGYVDRDGGRRCFLCLVCRKAPLRSDVGDAEEWTQ